MERTKITILWSTDAIDSLEKIYNYYFDLSKKSAERIRLDILSKISMLHFVNQYQIDEINPQYRRIIVRHYKVVYKVDGQEILILNIFDSRQDPSKSKLE